MNCAETVLISGGMVYVCRHESADHHKGTPITEIINPLRYQVCLGGGPGRYKLRWNKDAWMWLVWSNFWFNVRRALAEQETDE